MLVLDLLLKHIIAVTNNTRSIDRLQKSRIKLCFDGRQSKKSRWNCFESLQDSKSIRQETENFTSLREGKMLKLHVRSEPDNAKRKGHFLIKHLNSLHVLIC